MHRLPSSYTLRRFRIASTLVIMLFLMIPVIIGLLVSGIYLGENRWFLWAGISTGVALVCLLVNFSLGSRLRCPLCMVPPLVNRRCSKHREAARLFGSHRLKVAQSIMFKDSFRCPYCGEPTAMEVRPGRPR